MLLFSVLRIKIQIGGLILFLLIKSHHINIMQHAQGNVDPSVTPHTHGNIDANVISHTQGNVDTSSQDTPDNVAITDDVGVQLSRTLSRYFCNCLCCVTSCKSLSSRIKRTTLCCMIAMMISAITLFAINCAFHYFLDLIIGWKMKQVFVGVKLCTVCSASVFIIA